MSVASLLTIERGDIARPIWFDPKDTCNKECVPARARTVRAQRAVREARSIDREEAVTTGRHGKKSLACAPLNCS